jgi:periplasmic divalent cation tolerance protein
VESKFWWKDKVEKSKEVLILIKALRAKFKKIEKEISKLHSYEVPEIIAIPVVAGSKEYLKWIGKETGG